MKKDLLIVASLIMVLNVQAERFDPYNTIILNKSTDAKFENINTQLKSCFAAKGFKVYSNSNWADVPQNEWDRTLYVEWEVDAGYGIPSVVTVEIYNSSGQEIATYSETGFSFSINADVNIAIGKIIRLIKGTPYHYSENTINDQNKYPPIRISEDSVRTYLLQSSAHDIEGIYKTLGQNWCRFAIIKQNNRFVAFIIDTDNPRFKKGDVKAYFEQIKKNVFSTTYIMGDRTVFETLATFEEGILKILWRDEGTLAALKIFPVSDEDGLLTISPQREEILHSTGSGFFISDRIIVTNNHVIENASSIKIVVKNDIEVKSYSARVLVTDKTNDLALISITDKEFKGIKSIPYSLFLDTKEVGTSIFTMGYPMSDVLGSDIKVTDGIISSKTGFQGDIVTYQITAPIQPGNSGGALFDKNGVLVGITNAGVRSAENVGYAIKTIYLKNLIDAAPVYIELPTGKDLKGKTLPDLVKIFSPYVVFVEVY